MSGAYRLYGAPGWGSVLVEAMLTLCGAPYAFEDVQGFHEPSPARDRLLAVNPLAQIPTLVTPEGAVLTESAAVALWLAEQFPEAGLAPPAGDPDRARFLNRLIWLVAAVYPTFTYGDWPERWVEAEPSQLRQSTDRRREALWRQFEPEIPTGGWALGERFSVLDVFVAVMTRWRPRRAWFEEHCPKVHAIALRCEALPALQAVVARNYLAQEPVQT